MIPSKWTTRLAAAALMLAPATALATHHRPAAKAMATADDSAPTGFPDSGMQLVGGVLAMLGGTIVIGMGLLARRR